MATKLDETFASDGIALQLSLPADRVDALKAQLRDATRDRVRDRSERDKPPFAGGPNVALECSQPSSLRHDRNDSHQSPDRLVARAVAVRACASQPVRRLAAGAGLFVDGDAQPAGRVPADDRPGLLERREHRPGVRVPVRGRAGARVRDGGALLLRFAARRARRGGHAPAAVLARHRAGCRLPRPHPQRRTGLAPDRRCGTAAQRGRLEHVGGVAQRDHGDRLDRDAVRHQPAPGELRIDRHSAGGAADRDRRAAAAEGVACQPGSRRRRQHPRRRNAGCGANRAGACTRTLRAHALRPRAGASRSTPRAGASARRRSSPRSPSC